MFKRNLFIISLFFVSSLSAQTTRKTNPRPARPKLVVGIVVDQMRWDFLYRYRTHYSANGFNRMLGEGFTCENAFIPYTPTVTAAGHTCVYTGSVPAIHGIVGNAWYDRNLKRTMYCSESVSDTVKSVGGDARNGKMSPANMATTTVTDELRLASNFQSRVVGVCIKDRGAIFPAGHTANAAFWYDGKTGNWITSSFYMKELPGWLQQLNTRKLPDEYYRKNWNLLKNDKAVYALSDEDEQPYEGKMPKAANTSFPHSLTDYIGKDYEAISTTPYGNSMTLDVARAALEGYELGLRNEPVTDFLAISLSSTDYVGHRFGPNSMEVEDTYLRLDEDLAAFFTYLDTKIGAGKYTVFLTADHGVAHVPGFLKKNRVPAGNWNNEAMLADLRTQLRKKYDDLDSSKKMPVNAYILSEANYQVYLDEAGMKSDGRNREEIVQYIINYCKKQEAVADAFELKKLKQELIQPQIAGMLLNGYNKERSGDIQVILKPAWIDGGATGTTHGLWNPYDAHIPLVFMGWGIPNGKLNRTVHMTDIAATVAALLKIQMPNGCVGEVITEAIK